jgi:nucleoid-associated protein YgaU
MSRVSVIALATFREAVRDKILHSILFFAGLLLVLSLGVRELSVGDTGKAVQGVALGGIALIGAIIAVFLGASALGQIGPIMGVIGAAKVAAKQLFSVIDRVPAINIFDEGGAKPATPAGMVSVRTGAAGEEGAWFASGLGPPGATVRLYLNEAFVADVKTAPDGTWTLRVERGMSPGHYEVRADLVEEGGKVAARAQVPFDYPQQLQAAKPVVALAPAAPQAPPAAPQAQPAAPQAAAASQVSATLQVSAAVPAPGPAVGLAVVPELQSITVVRGDSLWRISRRILGQGQRYTQIYEANPKQIRDPNRIFPGQVLVAPRSLTP